MARIIERSVVLADSGVDISPLGPNTSEPVSVITNSFSSFVAVKHSVFGKRIPHDVNVFGHPLLILVAGFIPDAVRFTANGTSLPGSRPVSKNIALTGNVLTDFAGTPASGGKARR